MNKVACLLACMSFYTDHELISYPQDLEERTYHPAKVTVNVMKEKIFMQTGNPTLYLDYRIVSHSTSFLSPSSNNNPHEVQPPLQQITHIPLRQETTLAADKWPALRPRYNLLHPRECPHSEMPIYKLILIVAG